MTPWDIVLALCIVLAVFLMGRAHGASRTFDAGYVAGFRDAAKRAAKRSRDKPPTRPT